MNSGTPLHSEPQSLAPQEANGITELVRGPFTRPTDTAADGTAPSLATINFFVGPLLLACGACGALTCSFEPLQPQFLDLPSSLRDYQLISMVLSLGIVALGFGSIATGFGLSKQADWGRTLALVVAGCATAAGLLSSGIAIRLITQFASTNPEIYVVAAVFMAMAVIVVGYSIWTYIALLTFAQFKPFLAPMLISFILTLGEAQYRFLASYWSTGSAIATSILLELILGKFMTGKWPHLASSFITGISVGIVLQSISFTYFILCSLLSITSKYAIRVKGRHLFNPSNLGVSILLFLLPGSNAPLATQWGNNLVPPLIIFTLGSAILLTLGRYHITITYLAAFTALSWVRSEFTDNSWLTELALLTSPGYQLFMFFMITDPKTTTRTKGRQCAVAVIVALVETILRLNREIHAPYYALFIVAPVTNIIEIWWDGLQARKACALKAEAAVVTTSPSEAIMVANHGIKAN